MSESDEKRYWEDVHQENRNDLGAVCHPTKPEVYNRFVDRVFRKAWKPVVGTLKPGDSFEVGCGRGRWISDLRRRGWKARGVDIAANSRCDIRGTALALPVKSEQFDLVYAVTVLQHIDDKETALKEMYRVARPGGVVMLIELLDRPEVEWQDHVMPRSAIWWREQFANRGLSMEWEKPVEYLPVVQWLENRASRRLGEKAGSTPTELTPDLSPAPESMTEKKPASGLTQRIKRAAWLPVTAVSWIAEPFAPYMGVRPTHRLFMARK